MFQLQNLLKVEIISFWEWYVAWASSSLWRAKHVSSQTYTTCQVAKQHHDFMTSHYADVATFELVAQVIDKYLRL